MDIPQYLNSNRRIDKNEYFKLIMTYGFIPGVILATLAVIGNNPNYLFWEDVLMYYGLSIWLISLILSIHFARGRLMDLNKNPNYAYGFLLFPTLTLMMDAFYLSILEVILLFIYIGIQLYLFVKKGSTGINSYGLPSSPVQANMITEKKPSELSDEDEIMTYIIESSKTETYPITGKTEKVKIIVLKKHEKLFYKIDPQNIKKFKRKLDYYLKFTLSKNENIYGHQYAERQLFIGDELIFSWKNEMTL